MSIQTKSLHAEIVAEILDGHGLPRPDGRPLHAYMVTDAQFERMARTLRMRVAIGDDRRPTAEIFALWASEKIRRDHRGGPLKWELLFDAIDAAENQALARTLTASGLDGFGRDIRRSERGALYLYSLMAEGGLPDALIAEAGRFRDEIVAMVAEIEAEGRTRPEAAAAIVERRLHALPLAFRTEETQELFAEFAAGLIALRAKLPADVDETTLSEELTKLADWRAHLPVRLSTAALRELVGPALLAPLGRRSGPRPALARRQLRRAADGVSWTGALTIADQGILPHERLPEDVRELRLRFLPGEALASCHEAFFGAPEPDGWRLSRIGRRGDAVLPLDPSTPARLCAHADGRHVGDALIDGGLDAPEESPSFWKSVGDGMLEPLGATGVTRGDAVWLLAPPETRPDASEGVVLSGPEPAPGGLLWRLAGDGDVRVGHRVLKLRTAADSDAPSFQLVPVGTPLRGWRDPLGWPVFVGEPRFFGGETDGASRSVAGSTLARNPAKRLFAQAAIWIRNGTEQARSRLIVLPRDCRIRVSALPRGGAAVDLTGLPAGLTASLGASEPEAGAAIPPSGDLHLRLVPEATAPAHLHLRLYDSRSGRALTLHAPWPGREAVFAAPDGARLEQERQIAIGSLPGWRGIYPEGGGVLQIRPEGGGERIAIAGDGEISLSAQESFLRSLLAQLGPDGSLRLRLVAGGVDSPRLVVRRHEWSPKRTGDVLDLGPSRVSLHALPLDGACGPVEREAAGPLDLRDTLGSGPSVW
ncbi:MAG: STY4851/ECs_5259 family protein, partial [Pseudomonadota bacterium]|nr:STY4851/ECs_5259 family protein [Pseudomonadota bacterium]